MRLEFKKPNCIDCEARTNSYFNNLSIIDLRELNREKTCNLYKKNQNIFYAGTNSNGIYCLQRGRIKLFKQDITGKEQIIRFIAPGQLFGLKSFIERGNYSATSTALEDSIVCFINKDKIFNLMRIYPNLTNYMLVSLSKMLNDAESRMTSIALKNVRERVAEVLIILLNTYNTDEESMEIRISREDLANCAGSATENVIRVLSDFKQEKLISIRGKILTILNIKGLQQVGNLIT
ncbi:Crp/Fnr family transcriptional regulator [Bacteroidota bacterium]